MKILALLLLSFAITPAFAQSVIVGFPDETNTGVPPGTTLQNVSQQYVTLSTNGMIYENKNLTGCIIVQADNVTIRNSRITGLNCGYSTISNQGSNLLIHDVEIHCEEIPGTNGLTFGNYTVRRVRIHGCENGAWIDSNTLVEDSYIHNLIPYYYWFLRGQDPHTDGLQMGAGQSNITVRHNRIYGQFANADDFGNSAITTGGGNSNVLIENNILAGGGYTVRCEGSGSNTNYRVINNFFSRIYTPNAGFWGPINLCDSRATQFSGNVYLETGALLPNQPAVVRPNPPTGITVQ